MTKLIAMSALAAALSIGAAAEAGAWTRNGSASGPRGTSSMNAWGNCSGGTCSRGATRTGPYGNSMNSQGSVTCANGTCNSSGQTTGPYGGSRSRSGSFSR